MPYVDYNYYTSTYEGEPVSQADFPELESTAEMIVEEMTMFRLNDTTFNEMPVAMQTKVKNAVCAQIEYLDNNGGRSSLNEESDDLQSAGLGKFSYNKEPSNSSCGFGRDTYSPLAMRFLFSTGMLYRGGGG